MLGIFKKEKKYNNLRPKDFELELKDHPKAVILDVRTPGEFQSGHLPGAKNIDFFRAFKQKAEKLNRNKKYMVYCRSGNRSASACKMMANMGFEDLTNMSGGIMSWKGKVVD